MTTTADPDLSTFEAYLAQTEANRMASYEAFLRIPSVSALPEHAEDCRRAAEFVAADLKAIGIEHVEVSATTGNPVVYGDWLHAGPDAPTVIVYGHYDVQPPDPLDEWLLAPFEPLVRDGRMLARGAADDKGQIHAHLRALEALMRTRGRLPVNLRFLFEGNEESSAEHVDGWLVAHKDLLAGDLVVISDTSFFEGNVPAITIGLRGLMYAQVNVHGPSRDLHSGAYGGTVQNPANALAAILAGLVEPDGRIAIPGFYDDVVPLSDADRSAMARLPFDEEQYRRELGVLELIGETGWTTMERKGARPTLDVDGIWGGFQGEGPKTIIPARAHAKVSCRLVPKQDPERIYEAFRDHVMQTAPRGVTVTVESLGHGRPSLTPIDHPATQAAARAIEASFGRTPLFFRDGGSIPICDSFERILGLPVVLFGFTNPDDNAHAPNESMVLANYEGGIRAVTRLWDELASLGRSGLA
jgi:acetylornithine deacetylase/succinyl-diaminopimelate desuccinylase-like protein